MTRIHIGIGSNIDPQRHVPWAIEQLRMLDRDALHGPIYETAPIDRPEQDAYWNTVVALRTNRSREEVVEQLAAWEQAAGRKRTGDRYAARTLDLDILLWDGKGNDDADGDLARPWNQWCLHHLGDGARPDNPEPEAVG